MDQFTNVNEETRATVPDSPLPNRDHVKDERASTPATNNVVIHLDPELSQEDADTQIFIEDCRKHHAFACRTPPEKLAEAEDFWPIPVPKLPPTPGYSPAFQVSPCKPELLPRNPLLIAEASRESYVDLDRYLPLLYEKSLMGMPPGNWLPKRVYEPYFNFQFLDKLNSLELEIFEVIPSGTRQLSTPHNLAGFLRHRYPHRREMFLSKTINMVTQKLWRMGLIRKSVDSRWFKIIPDGRDFAMPFRLPVPIRKIVNRDRRVRGLSHKQSDVMDSHDLTLEEAFLYLPGTFFNPMCFDFSSFLKNPRACIVDRNLPQNRTVGPLTLGLFPFFDEQDTEKGIRMMFMYGLMTQFLQTYLPELSLDTFQMLDVYLSRRRDGLSHFRSVVTSWCDLTFHERMVLFMPAQLYLNVRSERIMDLGNFLTLAWTLYPCELTLTSSPFVKSLGPFYPKEFVFIPSQFVNHSLANLACRVRDCGNVPSRSAYRTTKNSSTHIFDLCTLHYADFCLGLESKTQIYFQGDFTSFEEIRLLHQYTAITFRDTPLSTLKYGDDELQCI